MEFRTPISIPPSSNIKLDYQSRVITFGSCFANVIGDRLLKNKFKALSNPFGTIFNPLSLFKLLEAAAEGKNHFRDSFIQNKGIWYNFDFHSEFSSASKEELEAQIDTVLLLVNQWIKETKIITITLGTSFVYRLNLTQEVVANCHKVPAFNFEKTLLNSQDIYKAFEKLYLSIKYINPQIQFVFTVSPVRHIKDGMEANSVSKSILRTACHLVTERFEDVHYFPAFEIMMDDLRDYRFYKEDMIHPSEVAENYIWEKFLDCYASNESKKILKDWTLLLRAIEHRPFHPESEGYQKFLKDTINKTRSLRKVIDVETELRLLEGRLL